MSWAFKRDAGLRLASQDNLSTPLHESSFKQTAGEAVFSKARVTTTLGNRAVAFQGNVSLGFDEVSEGAHGIGW